MAKKIKEPTEYLYGTFRSNGKMLSISKDTSIKKIEEFLKGNAKLKARLTDKDRINKQRSLIDG